MMTTKDIKNSVVDTYGQLAKYSTGGIFSSLFACCNPTAIRQEVAQKIGYTKEDLATVPEHSNLGVGCGNPSSYLSINKRETVLDLGTGAGFDAFLAAPKVGEEGQVIGVDLSDEMLKLARKNAAKTNTQNVKFIKGDIEDLPLDSATVDKVISNCVINLSLRKDLVYKEAFRVLKPGGMIAISDIVLLKELPEFVSQSLSGHVACVAGAEPLEVYLAYIKAAGFKNITVVEKTGFPLEIMLTDPQVIKIAQKMNFSLESEEAKDLASRVLSISVIATK